MPKYTLLFLTLILFISILVTYGQRYNGNYMKSSGSGMSSKPIVIMVKSNRMNGNGMNAKGMKARRTKNVKKNKSKSKGSPKQDEPGDEASEDAADEEYSEDWSDQD